MDLEDFFSDFIEPTPASNDVAVNDVETKQPEQPRSTTTPPVTSATTATTVMTVATTSQGDDTKQADDGPPQPPRQPSRTALTVAAVTDGALVESLSSPIDDFDKHQRQRCLQVVGFAPIDLFDPDMNRQLFKRDQRLVAAINHPMTRSFAVGINGASGTFCNAIILILMSRNLLDENLAAMGSDPDSESLRSKLVDLSSDIQNGLHVISTKAENFVSVLTKTIREMGEAAFELETSADPEEFSKMFENVDFTVSDQADGLDEELKKILGNINEGVRVIKKHLTTETRFAEKESAVETARANYETAEDKLLTAIDERFREETTLTGQIRRLQGEKIDLERKKQIHESSVNIQDEEVSRIENELKKLRHTKNAIQNKVFDESTVPGLKDISQLAEQLKNGQAETVQLLQANARQSIDMSSVEMAAQTPTEVDAPPQPTVIEKITKIFKDKFKKMVQNEIEARRRVIQDRIEQLSAKEKQLEREAHDYRERSKTASDGYQRVPSDSFVAIWDKKSRSAKNTMCTICNVVCHANCQANARGGCYQMISGSCSKCSCPETAHILGVTKQATTSQQIGINERERLQQLAKDIDANAEKIRTEMAQLRAESAVVPKEVLAEMTRQQADKEAERQRLAQDRAQFVDEQKRKALENAMEQNNKIREHNRVLLDSIRSENAKIREDNEKILESAAQYNERLKAKALEAFHDDKANALRVIDEQIEAMETMLNKAKQSRNESQEKLEAQNSKMRENEDEEYKASERLKDRRKFHQRKVERFEQEEQAAQEEYDKKSRALRKLIEDYGIEKQEDYASFMKTFNLMNKSMQNLPIAVKQLSATFRDATTSFSSDKFKRKLSSVGNDEKQRLILRRMAESFQSICEVGLKMFGDPVRKMIAFDASAVFTKLVEEEQKRRAIEQAGDADVSNVGGTATCTIEEVDDDDNVVEEPEIPRRKQ